MADARRAARQRIESLQRAGVTGVRKSRGVQKAAPAAKTPGGEKGKSAAKPPATSQPTEAIAPVAKAVETTIAAAPPLDNAADRNAALNLIREKVVHCTRCKELCTTRTQTVFGVGNPMTRLVFLGEAPGADEDKQGEPFVGRAGQLLDKIIEACTLKREQIYILNILKCRPPGNRNPEPDEAANCREYLEGQLDIIRPDFICCLGAVAARNLLQTEVPISKLRGKLQTWRGVQVMCTYHPAYLLRNPAAKRDVWEDMKTLMRAMGVDVDKKGS
jgi:uracil-DNA glycosylase family 4